MLSEIDRYWRSRCVEIRVVDANGAAVEPPYLEPHRPLDRTDYPGNIAHEVKSGETWYSIAYRYLGDARHWKIIADFSEVIDPFSELAPGDVVIVPSMETVHFILLDGGLNL